MKKQCKVQIWSWPVDPKINRGPLWQLANTCLKLHHYKSKVTIVTVQKWCKVQIPDLTFNLLTPKSGVPPLAMIIWQWPIRVKYHPCMSKGKRVNVQKRCKVQIRPWTFWSPNQYLEVHLWQWQTHVWRIIIVCQKVKELTCRNDAKFKFQI